MYKIGAIEDFNLEDDSETLEKIQNNNLNQYLWKSESGNLDDNDRYNTLSIWTKFIKDPAFTKYYIAHNDKGLINGYVEPNSQIKFGYSVKYIEIFDDRSEWESRINEIGIDLSDLEI